MINQKYIYYRIEPTPYSLHMVLRNGSLVCDICWTTLFDFNNFQEALGVCNLEKKDLSQGYVYTTQAWKDIDDGENSGCNWCDFLWGDILEYRKQRRDQHLRTDEWPDEDERWKVTVQFRKDKDPPCHMRLTTYIGDDHFPNTYEIHTTHGMSTNILKPLFRER